MKFRIPSLVIALAGSMLFGSCVFEPVEPEDEVSEESVAEVTTQPEGGTGDTGEFIKTLPDVELPAWNEKRATELVALPLSCVDRLHKQSRDKGYLYERSYALDTGYEDSLSFYGCSDWHSAVNSTWTMVKILKEFPDMWLGALIREKLGNHLSEKSLAGELHFFEEVASRRFERPYGWAWLMKLYTELITWDDPDAEKWEKNLAPLVELLAERTIPYLDRLSHPLRIGTHNNTAFSLTLMLEYARRVNDQKLEDAIIARATDFFAEDVNCPVRYEPSGSDFFSPCLTEAVLMSSVLEPGQFVAWLDAFMPAVDSDDFKPLISPVEMKESYLPETTSTTSVEPTTTQITLQSGQDSEPESETESETEPAEPAEDEQLKGAQSHLIGLSFYRAGALKRLAAALPEDDVRRLAYEKLAAIHGENGFTAMYEADYVGTHWLASYAVYMLVSEKLGDTE
jgi:hypothetical protein